MDTPDDSISFDKYKLETELNKKDIKFYKIKENATFSFLPENIKCQNNEKYYVNIKNKNEQYIGVLTNTFKKELFGYTLFYQGDEYLGQIFKEKKNGFGIYKFKTDNDGHDIYIGEFLENNINGEGIYINILKIIEDERKKTKKLMNYNCSIGLFENGKFKKGKIYKVDDAFEKMDFKDYIKENDDREGKEIFNFEKKNNIYIYSKGLNKDKRLIEGNVIYIKDNDKIVNKFSFKLNNSLQYDFKYLDDEKIEKELLKEFQDFNFSKYNIFVQTLFNKIEEIFNNIKIDKFDTKLIQGGNFKNYFSENLNSLIN